MAARVKQKVTTHVRTRVKKDGSSTSYKPCGTCHGTGVVKKKK